MAALPPLITIIDMQAGRYWRKCPMCNQAQRLDHAVGWYCGPTHDEIGSITTEYMDGGEVCGMSVCKGCHDAFYASSQKEQSNG